MKKQLFLGIFSLLTITAFGQAIPAGTRFLGGDLNFYYGDNKSNGNVYSNTFNIGVSPSFTKFIKDNSSVTVDVSYGLQSNGSKSSLSGSMNRSSSNTISAGVFFRNYKMITEKFGASIHYGGRIGTSFSGNVSGNSDKIRNVTLTLSAGPGVIYFLNEQFALEGTASLVNLTTTYGWYGEQSSFSIGTGLSVSPSLGIGFRYILK